MDKKELFETYVALDQIGAIVDRVNRYRKVLSIKDEESLTSEEKIYLLACAGLDLEFKPRTEESLTKAALLAVVVESTIPSYFK